MSEEAALYGDDEAADPGADYEGAALYSDEAAAPAEPAQSDSAANGEGEPGNEDAVHYQTEDYTPQAQQNNNQSQSQPQQSQQQQQRAGQFSKFGPPASTSPSSVASSHPPGINPLSVYVENLPVPLTDADLRAHFSPYGVITTTKLNINMQTGDQLGYGFVEYGTEEEAKRAVDGVNGSLMGGRTLRARFATARGAKRERDANFGGGMTRPGMGMGVGLGMGGPAAGMGAVGGGAMGDKPVNPCNLYVAGLPWLWTQQDVEQCFSAFGAITDCKLLINLQTKESKGVAFVKLDSEANAQRAINTLHGKQMDGGTVLQVRVAHENKRPPMGAMAGGMAMQGGMGGAMGPSRMAGGMGGMMRGGMGLQGGMGGGMAGGMGMGGGMTGMAWEAA